MCIYLSRLPVLCRLFPFIPNAYLFRYDGSVDDHHHGHHGHQDDKHGDLDQRSRSDVSSIELVIAKLQQ
jgi:hypothetical protein